MEIFERLESQVRSYSRSFPVVFERAKGCFLYDTSGKRYIDFFCGAGTMNYGHNPDVMKSALIEFLQNDGLVHSLDMATAAKAQFLETLESVILKPRGLDYKVQFVAPSGANAVEAALKLARITKQRSNIIAFTNSYHGLSLGALAVTANSYYRNEAFIQRTDAVFMPYECYFGEDVDTIAYMRRFLSDSSSGIDRPAAVIVETVQAEGGIHVASAEWLRRLARLCREFDMLLIVDDIQVGNGRTGTFFSFERAGIEPDIVLLSKAIGGFGLPLSILLLKPELDRWKPGEHTGTFRGDNLSFVTAAEALKYWKTPAFADAIQPKSRALESNLHAIQQRYPELDASVRGCGMIFGLDIPNPEFSRAVSREAFSRGLVLELCGEKGRVLKCLPPLCIEPEHLLEGMRILEASVQTVLSDPPA